MTQRVVKLICWVDEPQFPDAEDAVVYAVQPDGRRWFYYRQPTTSGQLMRIGPFYTPADALEARDRNAGIVLDCSENVGVG